ncbi:response regulator [Desulfomonile tiedjei]|uniref:Response regulator with CheY-like receiver, AAA-type ATPase, and DNA-binding domains n=1 Tax=Desulfomonile tiedjei (strain ATCC 49306 / DSM 6799 / DCB-1) TaxID=706587 RepID=I4C0A3_DESTA|nr:response regulator [Desulfomonile tiedjei]AFM22994.1 response regulator with CheY-like receiver, AAA-type ATPase, and DNA-binding domains [Desulfomonile tiedjei DSM 6799]
MNATRDLHATILVVDDEQIVHESIQRILDQDGHRVISAMRVDQALQELEKKHFDLALTDLKMPGTGGMEVVRAIAENHPDMGVVVFTGFPTVDSAIESMKLGALDYLPKPFTPEELLQVTRNALQKIEKLKKEREMEKIYAEAEKALKASLDLREIFDLICSSVSRLFNVTGSAVLMFRKKDQTLELAASCGLSEMYVRKGALDSSRSIAEAMKSGRAVLVQESEFDLNLQYPDEARNEKFSSVLSIPLKLEDSVFGFLRLYSTETRTFSDDELDLLMKFAEQATRALENAMTYERVRTEIEELKKYLPQT